jgi:hypothetical protein
MKRKRWASAAGCLAVTGAVGAVPASSQPLRGHVAGGTTCKLSKKDWTSFGYSYFEWLWVNRTSCTTGRYVAKHHGRVSGWHCTRKITDRARFQYDATETCTGSGRTVQWKYTQNT